MVAQDPKKFRFRPWVVTSPSTSSEVPDSSFPPEDPQPGGAWLLGALLFVLPVAFACRGLIEAGAGAYLGGGEIEGWLWRYWWMKEMILGARDAGPAYTLYATLTAGSYPEFGNVLDLQVLSWPLEVLFGAPAYYNLKIALVLTLNCAAAWWFLTRVWGPSAAAWAASLVYGLNPYFLFEIAHGRVRQAVAFTIPLFALYLYRSWRTGERRDTLLAGLFMGLTAALYLYYGMFLGFLWVLFALWHLALGRRHPHAPSTFKRMAAIAALGLAITLPFTVSYLEQALRHDLPEVAPYGTAFPSLEEVTTPTATARPRNLLSASQKRFTTDSLPLDAFWDPGLRHAVPLAALLAALLTLRRPPWFWLGTFFFFATLSLGPYLKVGEDFPLGGLPMPHQAFFQWVPSFSRLFSPIRLEVVMYLALAVLVTQGLAKRSPLFAALVVLATLAQLETARVLPLPAVHVETAPYYHLLKDLPPTGLVEVPFKTGDYLEFNQTVHRQKVLWSFAEGGTPPGYPPNALAHLARKEGWKTNTFVSHLEGLNKDPDHPPEYDPQDMQAVVEAGYRLLILHERGCYYLDPQNGERVYFRLLEHLRHRLGEPLVFTDEPVHRGLTGRRRGDRREPAWYRMAVFALPDR